MRKPDKKIRDISLKDIKSYFRDERYKIKKNITDYCSLPERIFTEMSPVFVVSTGRAGSELLVKLMNASKVGSVYHEPSTRMFLGSKLAFEFGEGHIKAKRMAYLNARYDLLKKAYLEDKRFVETNNRITFFMVALGDLFPKAKFIHLVRHPGAFVRSCIRRNYYNGNENDDGRITPLKSDSVYDNWANLGDIEKIGWLWNETNAVIELAKEKMDEDRVKTIISRDLFTKSEIYQDICTFIDHALLDKSKINSIIKKPTNPQKQNVYPKWKEWSEHDKHLLIQMTPLGEIYGFWNSTKNIKIGSKC